jgi:hypothetical protein
MPFARELPELRQLEKKEFIDIMWRKEGAICMLSKGKGKNKT